MKNINGYHIDDHSIWIGRPYLRAKNFYWYWQKASDPHAKLHGPYRTPEDTETSARAR
jgi:hypothetical protein